jgi:hypothetical protein
MTKKLILFLLASVSMAQPKLSVLIVDGVNNHDWQTATRELKSILSATGRFQVDVSTSPPRDAPPDAWMEWRPRFDAYNAVLLNWNGGDKGNGLRWPAEVETALVVRPRPLPQSAPPRPAAAQPVRQSGGILFRVRSR